MAQLVRRVLLAVGCGVLAWQLPAAQPLRLPEGAWKLPPLDGDLSGEFKPLNIEAAPTLKWKLAVQTLRPGVRAVGVMLEGPGTLIRADLELDPSGNGSWRVHDSQIDIAVWAAATLDVLGEEFKDAKVSGTITMAGEGTWRAGVAAGKAKVGVRDGRVDHPGRKLLLEGIDLDLALDDVRRRRSPPHQSLRWKSGFFDEFPFGLGHVDFSLRGDQVSVEEGSVEIFGGEVVIAAFSFSTVRREASVIARVVGIQVEKIVQFLPKIIASAQGRVDGTVSIHRSITGVQVNSATLALRAGELADLRLAPTPGLISGSLPPAILQYYPGLGKIETGEVPLRADKLEMEFTPLGDSQGRTAVLHLAGGPVDPKLRAPVDLTINVRGPLDQLIKFGMDSRLKIGGGKP